MLMATILNIWNIFGAQARRVGANFNQRMQIMHLWGTVVEENHEWSVIFL